ncbi:MAG: aminotransferase class IV [Alphaproteobacteria bacterium]|nr:aminotransferase class IV [Alphaproteobacteria bacterium]
MLGCRGALKDAEAHYARLFHDADTVLGVTPPYDPSVFKEAALSLMKGHDLPYVRVRTVITAGVLSNPLAKAEHPTYLITISKASDPAETTPATCVIVSDFPRVAGCRLENCKRTDYTRAYAARRRAELLGASDALMTNSEGNIACATTSNIFIVESGQWITPPLTDGVIEGITRRHVICTQKAREESISPARLKQADQIFLTNSLVGVRPAWLLQGD